MLLIAGVRRDADLPNFVTLTYPERFPDVKEAKRDLKIFLQRLERRFPAAGYIWKLEPQERGAPHYHLLVWGVQLVELFPWVVSAWFAIAGQGDINHRLFHSGSLEGSRPCVEAVRTWRGVWSYASKYLGKTFEVAEWGQKWTGRFWGAGGRENIPFGEEREIACNLGTVYNCMRYQRRFARLRRASKNSLTIFCDADQWIAKVLRL